MRLCPDHQRELVEGSAIDEGMIERAGIYSESDTKKLAKLIGRRPRDWEPHVPALVFPYYLPGQEEPQLFRAKPSRPFERRTADGQTKVAKYVSPKGSEAHIYFPPPMLEQSARLDHTRPLMLTEGEKKALSASSHGYLCLGLSGVSQWHRRNEAGLHPDFRGVTLKGRDVFIIFDRDALTNHQVRRQELSLAGALHAAGATVFVLRLPSSVPKLDDALRDEGSKAIDDLMRAGRLHGAWEPSPIAAVELGTAHTDLGNAERYWRDHGPDLRHCAGLGGWIAWDGVSWNIDHDGEAMRRGFRTVRSIRVEAEQMGDHDEREARLSWALRSESVGRIQAMLRLSEAHRGFAVAAGEFDARPHLLATTAGVIDLRTGRLETHAREHLLTQITHAPYNPEAKSVDWDLFLRSVTGGDSEYAAWLQRAVGYSLTGETKEDRLFFLFGPAAQGKSTFIAALNAALGTYAGTIRFASLAADPLEAGDRPRPDLLGIRGVRLVSCQEIRSGSKLDEGLTKSLSGGDLLTVRGLNCPPVTFKPQAKLWLGANDMPHIRPEDGGLWRRLLRVPFDAKISPVVGFREHLIEDPIAQSAILNWAIQGAQEWYKNGLGMCSRVRLDSDLCRKESDTVAIFLQENCSFDFGSVTSREELRKEYARWAQAEGLSPLGARRFAVGVREAIRASGVPADQIDAKVRSWGQVTRAWRGIRLASEDERQQLLD